jgi:phenylalanyl-tRNA synthetase beta chain
MVRTSLLPGLLKCLQHNRAASFAGGFKLFEVSDAVLPDAEHAVTGTVVGARNARRVCATCSGPTSGFETIHGLVDRLLSLCEVAPRPEYIARSGAAYVRVHCREGWYYTVRELDVGSSAHGGTYFPGRAAEVVLTRPGEGEAVLGTFGVLHPEVLGNFDIAYPTSAVELDLEPLL